MIKLWITGVKFPNSNLYLSVIRLKKKKKRLYKTNSDKMYLHFYLHSSPPSALTMRATVVLWSRKQTTKPDDYLDYISGLLFNNCGVYILISASVTQTNR